jgi:hypothetical protein
MLVIFQIETRLPANSTGKGLALQKEESAASVLVRRARVDIGGLLEPALLALQIGSDKLFIRLRQIHDSLDDADDARDASRKTAGENSANETNEQHDHTFGCVTKNELMNTKRAQYDP